MRLFLAVALFAASALCETKPNFTGEWKLNASKSDFGRLPPPASMVRKIEHKDPELKIFTAIQGAQGEITTSYRYTTDGKECVNSVRGVDIKGSAKWDASTLVIDSERPLPNGAPVKTHEKWTLSDDGKTLTSVSRIAMPQGDLTTVAVLEKQ